MKIKEDLDENGLLHKNLSGSRKKLLTDSCLVQSTDFILSGMDRQIRTRMIFVDLQKAFDMLDHTLALKKLDIWPPKIHFSNGLSHIFK